MSIYFSTGNEHAPDDPFGRIVLEIDDDGNAKLEHFSRTGNGAWNGRMEPAELQAVVAAMKRGGFPERPPHPMPVPGTLMIELELDEGNGPVTLMMPLHEADEGQRLPRRARPPADVRARAQRRRLPARRVSRRTEAGALRHR